MFSKDELKIQIDTNSLEHKHEEAYEEAKSVARLMETDILKSYVKELRNKAIRIKENNR
jgi:hypothetical protein